MHGAIGARVSLLWQHTRLMLTVSEDGCTSCMAWFIYLFVIYSFVYFAALCVYRLINYTEGVGARSGLLCVGSVPLI